MALLLKDKTYVKFEVDGTFYIYKNKAARNTAKTSTNYNTVIAKYEEILSELSNKIRLYYSPEDRIIVKDWINEFADYRKNLKIYNVNEHYPLISQYIEDADNSIPKIILSMKYPKLAADAGYLLENIYKLAKEQELFGKIDEVKDC